MIRYSIKKAHHCACFVNVLKEKVQPQFPQVTKPLLSRSRKPRQVVDRLCKSLPQPYYPRYDGDKPARLCLLTNADDCTEQLTAECAATKFELFRFVCIKIKLIKAFHTSR